jgi:hypothetical protein
MSLQAEEFIRRFLQHVLPKGFHKVRYYGLLSPRKRIRLKRLQMLLAKPAADSSAEPVADVRQGRPAGQSTPCPICADGDMIVISWLPRQGRSPP